MDNMKEERNLSLGSFVSLAVFAGLLVSSIGTTSFLVQKQVFGQGFIKNQPQPTPFPGMNFSKPKDVWSKNGVLKTTLIADYRVGKLDNKTITAMVYNGSLPGPTLHVYPGDKLEINLINNLNEPTNIHFHGFHVSPANNSDNIFLEVAPGKTQNYTVYIPKDHPRGTDWYHPHLHGLTYSQVSAGMSGLLIVEGLQKLLPMQLQNITTQNFAIRDFPFDPLFQTTRNMSNTLTGHERLTVNGEINPQVNIKSGETQLWRIANIGPENYVSVGLAGHTFHIIAEDGYPVWKVRENNTLFLPSGKRFDLLVTANGSGSFPLSIVNDAFNDHPYGTVLATAHVQGNQKDVNIIPTTLQKFSSEQKDLSNATIAAHRVLYWQSDDRNWIYRINNRTFDPNRIDYKVKLGTVEEWKLIGQDPKVSGNFHPFHIHTNHFQVMSVNGKPYNAHGYQDTVMIPTAPGSVVIRIPFNDYVGKSVYHCHLLFHEDYGMMGAFEIVK
jgi:suppressor of ftsI